VRELLLNRRELEINIQNKAHDSALSYAIHYETYSTSAKAHAQQKLTHSSGSVFERPH
jgi:dihydroneopterin aldolase